MANVLTIGELLIRLTPPDHQRLHQTNQLNLFYGGAEANVAMNLSHLGHNVRYFSALPPNDIGEGAVNHLKAGGVDTSYLLRKGERLGLYFLEEGFSLKQANVIYDRKYSSIFELPEQTIDWDDLLKDIDLLHTTGITPALGDGMKEFTITALKEAKKRGIQVSFDFNYRSKLWGVAEAKTAFLEILPYVDICFAGYKDFIYLLDYKGPETFDAEVLKDFYKRMKDQYEITCMACTNRTTYSTSKNDLAAYLFDGTTFYESPVISFEILDRIGGGDSFASGVLHGILTQLPAQEVIEFGLASGVLKHMVYGDHNQFSEQEVRSFMANIGNDVSR
ncbi:sugar kinase [Thalassobacillus devorans]|uniref:sugar kinase n=1 Tax=Thalassobacillus devorans TaxID=279813 RepID=UPI00048B6747|nr:sugar kinase [Thalassobacillus devorans]